MDAESKPHLAAFEPVLQVRCEISWIGRLPANRINREGRFKLIFHEAVRSKSEGQTTPIRGRERARDRNRHVVKQFRRLGMRGKIGAIIAVDNAHLGECAHIGRSIDEEHIEILQYKIKSRVLRRAEYFRDGRLEKFDADTDRRLEVGEHRQRVR